MEWVETVAKTIPEALEIALDQLGVDERDAEVVVVEEPKSGLFGIGRTSARIRVRVRPAPPRPKRPQRNRRAEGSERRPGTRNRSRNAKPESTKSEVDEPGEGNSESVIAGASPPKPRRGGANRTPRAERPPTKDLIEEDTMSVEEQATTVQEFIQGVADRFGASATTTTRIEDNYIFVDVAGEGLGLMIGQRGATLEALQELARTVIQHRTDEQSGRVILDIAGFRAKRAAALAEFVTRVAEEVISSGVAQALEPMGAPDRKIVHDTVNGIDGVVTTSEGVDPRRYVVIRLAVTEGE